MMVVAPTALTITKVDNTQVIARLSDAFNGRACPAAVLFA